MKLKDVKSIKFYPLKEVAIHMGLKSRQLWNLVNSGKIKAINVGKTGKRPVWNFTAEAVQAYYDSISDANNGNQILDKQDLCRDPLDQAETVQG